MTQKLPLLRSRLFKVTDFGTNRQSSSATFYLYTIVIYILSRTVFELSRGIAKLSLLTGCH